MNALVIIVSSASVLPSASAQTGLIFASGTAQKSRANHHRARAKNQSRSHSTRICNASRGDHRNGNRIDNLRQQSEEAHHPALCFARIECAAMSAGLSTLRDDGIGSRGFRGLCFGHRCRRREPENAASLSSPRTNSGAYSPMIDEIALGFASSIAWHCASKSGSTPSAALSGTSGPHCARYSRWRRSSSASRFGAGPGIQRLI